MSRTGSPLSKFLNPPCIKLALEGIGIAISKNCYKDANLVTDAIYTPMAAIQTNS